MGVVRARDPLPRAAEVILLDTHALIWLEQGHTRVRSLLRGARRLHISPASLLELQFLEESGRIRLKRSGLDAVAGDERWVLDEPPSASWFLQAVSLGWTRDPFDRLLAAHALLRGWRLATADANLLKRLGPTGSLEL